VLIACRGENTGPIRRSSEEKLLARRLLFCWRALPSPGLFLRTVRVLLVVNWFLKYASEQAAGLAAAGAEVQVLCRDNLEEFAGHEREWHECVQRLTVATGRAPWVIEGAGTGAQMLRGTAGMARHARRWKPDIVHTHPNVSPALFVITPTAPLVLTVHDVVPHPGQTPKSLTKRLMDRAWKRRASGFIVHGEDLRRLLVARAGDRPVGVVPHGVRPESRPDPVPPRASILFFGRLEPYKGLRVLMDAMQLVWEVRPDAELVVAGRGQAEGEVIDDDPRIRKLARYVPEAEVDQLFRDAQLVVAAYTEGSQSGVVSLACARGIPAIVSDVGALPTLVADPSHVVPAGEPRALADALVRNLDHGPRLREAVHQKARQELSWDSAGKLTLRFYEELLARS
jgi:glycosyltransferase involved in cell wall biosynthesis